MSETTDTALVKTDNGPVRINRNEFNPDLHDLHEDDPQHPGQRAKRKQAAKPPETATDSNGVVRQSPPAETAPAVSMENADDQVGERVAKMSLGVVQDKKRFYIVDALNNAQRVTDLPGIEADGYASNKEAWDALYKVKTLASTTATVAAPGGSTQQETVQATDAGNAVPMPEAVETPPNA